MTFVNSRLCLVANQTIEFETRRRRRDGDAPRDQCEPRAEVTRNAMEAANITPVAAQPTTRR